MKKQKKNDFSHFFYVFEQERVAVKRKGHFLRNFDTNEKKNKLTFWNKIQQAKVDITRQNKVLYKIQTWFHKF